MGAVKSVGRIFWPSRASGLPKYHVKRPPQPSSGAPQDPNTLPSQPTPELLDRLKEVYVKSTSDIVTQKNPYASERSTKSDKLPQDRSAKYEDDFLVERSSDGSLTVQQVLEIFTKRREDPSEWTPDQVANFYKIDLTDADNLLKYFNNYRIISTHKPDTELKYHLLHR